MDFRVLQPSEYLAKFLEHQIRADGRVEHTGRHTTINTGSVSTADGSALVRTGDTVVLCGVKAELANPRVDIPSKGYIVCNVELPPCCSPHLSPGPPSLRAQALSQFLQDTVLSSGCVDPSQLCISEGKLCWALYVDVVCLCDDGNVGDASVLAATAALANTQLPDVSMESVLPSVSFHHTTPLPISSLPMSTSFGLFQTHTLLDPTAEEESVCTGQVTVATLGLDKVIAVHKTGTPSLSAEAILKVCQVAQERTSMLTQLVETATKRNNKSLHPIH